MPIPAEYAVNKLSNMTTSIAKNSFNQLLPQQIINALEASGWHCDGRIQAMASYENRVYQIGLESGGEVVAKFYRPERWSDAQIEEEFEFTDELSALDLPALTPLPSPEGPTLCHYENFRFSVYPKAAGHAPYFDNEEQLEQIGRLIARVHLCGFSREFEHRESFTFEQRALESCAFIYDGEWVPPELREAYEGIAEPILGVLDQQLGDLDRHSYGRLHGDMHVGNLLWSGEAPAILDFDDACNGPALQDLWMFLSGDRDEQNRQLDALVTGYETFRPFPASELPLVEALRTARMLYHTAWLARRWVDPAFPRAFPWFNTQKFWQDHILDLKEQLALLQDPLTLQIR